MNELIICYVSEIFQDSLSVRLFYSIPQAIKTIDAELLNDGYKKLKTQSDIGITAIWYEDPKTHKSYCYTFQLIDVEDA